MDFMLSQHFSLHDLSVTSKAEFAQINRECAADYCVALKVLCDVILEPAYKLLGGFSVTSAYRCAALNKSLGGAQSSQHILGEAADLVSARLSAGEMFALLKNADVPYGQLILETGGTAKWVHISLGSPFRNKDKCGESFVLQNGIVSNYERRNFKLN